VRNLSIGALASLVHTTTSGGADTPTLNTIGFGPRVGYDLRLGDRFSLWPRVAVLFSDVSSSAASAVTFDVQVFAPLLWHPVAHFFLGLGPFFQTDLGSSFSRMGTTAPWLKTTTYGLKLDLGGWVSTSSEPSSPPASPPTAPPERFGDPGQLAISNDVDLSFLAQSVTDQGGSQWTLSLAPGADYFVVRGLSIGGQVSYVRTWTKTYYVEVLPPTTTIATTATTDAFGIGPRVGYDIRIGDAMSIWPRVAVLYADTVASTTPAGANGSTKGSTFDVQLFAPVTWHPVPHFFAGLGPFVQTDVTASESVDGRSVPAEKTTTVGVKLDLGGWVR